MSGRIGSLSWYLYKADQFKTSLEFYEATQSDAAALDVATKFAELVGIGIPLWYVDTLFTKTGLDRVFDELRQNKGFQDYLKAEANAGTLRGVGLGALAEWGLSELNEWIAINGYLDPLFVGINDLWNQLKNWAPRRDPLAIDLDGDGIETIGADGTVVFDHDGDGVKSGTGWVSADDALLVFDRNGNNTIDTGAELFGVDTVKADGTKAVDGFDALSELDSNGDGVFNAQDTEFANVQIWQDADQDGISDAGELRSLVDAGIVSIDLNATANNVNLGNGNVQTATAAHLTVDGEEGTTGNLDLANNTFYRKFTDAIPLTDAARALPESGGSGMVRDLREAMSLSPALTTVVGTFSGLTTYAGQRAQVDALLEAWANTSTMQTSIELAEAKNFDLIYMLPGQVTTDFFYNILPQEKAALMAQQEEAVRMISILEIFNGNQFVTVEDTSVTTGAGVEFAVLDNPSSSGGSSLTKHVFVSLSEIQINLLTQSYYQLKESIYGTLVIQTRLADYTNEISLVTGDTGEISLDFNGMNAMLETRKGTDSINAFADLIELVRYQGITLDESGWDGMGLLQTWINAAEGDAAITALLEELNVTQTNGNFTGSNANEIIFGSDTGSNIKGKNGNDIIDAGTGNDYLYGENGNDVLDGGAGTDNLYGGAGEDTLRGGAGANDYLSGDAGNDTYLFGAGDGNTTVYNFDTAAGRNDVLHFLEGINPSDVHATRSSNNLYLRVQSTGEVITVVNYFVNDGAGGYALNAIAFADGTVWSLDAVKAMILEGTAGNDTMTGLASDDVMNGGAGNDSISGADGADTLSGEDGNDNLYGNNGNDVLDGGAGTDNLYGGAGEDTLRGGAGANDYLSGDAGNDTYLFGAGDGNTTVYNFDTAAGRNDVLRFLEGINPSDVRATRSIYGDLFLTVQSTGEVITVVNYFVKDGAGGYALNAIAFADGTVWSLDAVKAMQLEGTAGNDTMTGFASDDVMNGGAGNDSISGADGADTLSGGDGNDNLYGNNGNDVLDGGAGTDNLYGGAGEDTLRGGAGASDYMSGEAGNDTYLFGAGDGNTTVHNYDTAAGRNDVLRFLEGINPSDVRATSSSDDLLLTVQSTGEVIKVLFYFNAGYALNAIEFSDGTVWSFDAVKAMVLEGTAGNDTIVGFDSDDVINGGAGNDSISGTDGADTLSGEDGNDSLYGNNGNDVLDGGAGTDTLYGGAGDDTYVVDVSTDVVTENANEGTDTIESSVTLTLGNNVENLLLTGTAAINGTGNTLDNVLIGNSAVNTLTGGAGNDRLDGKAGADKMLGGTGNDTYVVDISTDVITENASEGTDTVESSVTLTLAANVENLTLTGTSAINGTGNTLGNILTGNIANNTLSGGTGADTMIGGAGDDIYVVDNAGDIVTENLNEGTDLVQSSVTTTLSANVENLLLTGTTAINGTGNALDNVLTGNAGINILTGGAGNDRLDGKSGADTMVGGTGDDTYVFNVATDIATENANEGIDTIESIVTLTLGNNVENLLLTGTSNINGTGNGLDNVLTGNSAVNTLTGGAGNDRLDGKSGADTMVGGTGDDAYVFNVATDIATENANEGIDTIESSVTLTLGNNVENLLLTGTSTINGTGNALDNVLTGNAGINILTGGAGNDRIDGKSGADTMMGGTGDDTYVFNVATDIATENANEGIDTIESIVTLTLAANVENLLLTGTSTINGTGNALDNVLTGNGAVNTLTGGAGNDRLDGKAGADKMLGGTGNDTYVVDISTDVITENANEGSDTVESSLTLTLGANVENLVLTGTTAINGTGNALDNVLKGNDAVNSLSGGAGNDTLGGMGGADTLTGGTGNDTYVLGRAYGADTVIENDATAGNTDIAQFLSGVAADQIWFQKVGNNLETSIIGTSDKLVAKDWYLGTAYHVEQFKTTDGSKTLLDSNVENLINAMASFAPPAAGQTTLPTDYQTALSPVIAANWQ